MARKNVPAQTVRNFLNSPEGQAALSAAGVETTVGSRGRHKPDQIAAFHKANPRLRYETKVAEGATVTVPVTMLDKAGRKRTEQRTLPTSEARTVLGHAKGKRGKFSKTTLGLALSAVEADAVADRFTK